MRLSMFARRVLPWAPLGLSVLLAAAALWLRSVDDRGASLTDTVVILILLLYALVGGLVSTREARNSVGWLMGTMSIAMITSFLVDRYVIAGSERLALPGVGLAGALGWTWLVALACPVLIAFVVPTGRPASRLWGRLLALVVAAFLLVLLLFALGAPGVSAGRAPDVVFAPNPLYVPWLRPAYEFLNAAFIIYIALFAAGAAALIARFRSSRGVERQQLKWIVGGVVLMIALMAASQIPSVLGDVLFFFAMIPLPASLGVAILRYRLYDIDVLINRTLVYAALSAVLVATYAAAVIATEAVLGALTGGNELAVAASTLLVVALFQPVRRRIQRAVDRRFYRARYDAERILDAFASRLRDEVDLDDVRRELLSAVAATVRPVGAGLWLRREQS